MVDVVARVRRIKHLLSRKGQKRTENESLIIQIVWQSI